MLHRDLKTANIFVAERDIVKLGDFGISKVLGSRSGFCSTVCGTPFYLSPEMCAGRRYDAKSDVWALGCVLYELCSGGRRAFEAPSLPAVVMKILEGEYPPLSAARWSPSLRRLLSRLLRLEPAGRPAAREVLRSPAVRSHLTRLTGRAGLCVLAREAAEGRNGEDEGGAEFESDAEPERALDPEIEGRRDPRRSEVRASERVREAREVRGGDAFARELTRESELAARREAGDAGVVARGRAEREGVSRPNRGAGRGEARGNAPRGEAREAEKAARAADARRAKAAHDARITAARASSRIDRRAVNPAFAGRAGADADVDVVLVPPPKEGGGGDGDVRAGRETRGNDDDATEAAREAARARTSPTGRSDRDWRRCPRSCWTRRR